MEYNSGGAPFSHKPDMRAFFKKTKRLVVAAVVAIIVLITAFSSVFFLTSSEEAIITRFGRYQRVNASSGMQFKLPFVEHAIKVNTETLRRMEFGYSSTGQEGEQQARESTMLTGDENIVIADWAIQYRVRNSYNYLYKVGDADGTLRVIAESSYRRVVATHSLDDILTDKKDAIQTEIREDLQAVCDKYELGVVVTAVQLQDAMPPDEVKAAFLDVASAREEKNSKINEARKYENERLPAARGKAASDISGAEGYKQQRINEAKGDVARFLAIQKEFEIQPGIMRTRLYLEMISQVLPGLKNVYFVDGNGETVQFLPLAPEGANTSVVPVG